MTKYALIQAGVVTTISFEADTGWPVVSDDVFPGDTDNEDGTFSRPVAPEPTVEEKRAAMLSLTARQFKLGLVRNSISLDTVAAQIAAITDDLERQEAEIEWQTAAQFERLNPLVVSIASAIGLTDEQVDTMWLAALEY